MKTPGRYFFSMAAIFSSMALILGAEESNIPPPLKIEVPFEAAWKGLHETIKDLKKLKIQQEDRGRGYLKTDYVEYISGPLTESYLNKIGTGPKLTDAYWLKVEYQYEAEVELISDRETLVTVNTNIRALKRDFLGHEEWAPITTNGQRETDLLNSFGKLLLGENFELSKSRKGILGRGLVYPRDMSDKTAGPERP